MDKPPRRKGCVADEPQKFRINRRLHILQSAEQWRPRVCQAQRGVHISDNRWISQFIQLPLEHLPLIA